MAGSSKDQLGSFRKCKQLDLDWHNLRPNLYWHRFDRDMVGRQGRARAKDSVEAWLEDSARFDSWARPEELGCEIRLGTTGLKDCGRILMLGECGRGSSGKSRACEIVGRGRT
ncbi:unnamed protein product [Prunus armeniaca]|uniref:Uncharacterized protein n=1 Tax=Prunus armeniaca TaxID=36596 RepID=A0A6J5U0I1_PRUAR|nr:unnamed protein product [Prunus armeniaca]